MLGRPEREGALHAGKGENDQKKDQDQARQDGAAQHPENRSETAARRPEPAALGSQALRQDRGDAAQCEEREPGCYPSRQLDIGGRRIIAGEQAPQRRADDKAEAKGRADQAHPLGAVLRSRDVGDIGLRRGNVAGAGAGKSARRKQHPERGRRAHPQIGQRRRRHADDQYRPPPDAVAEPAPQRRRHELHQRKDREQQRHLLRRGGKPQRIERQKRDNEAEPDEIDEDDEEQGRHVCRPDIAHCPRRGKGLAAPGAYSTGGALPVLIQT